jgi:hypothetical protein
VKHLQARLAPAKPADAQMVAKLIATLDSETFAQRDKAARDLEALGEAAEGALREASAGKVTLEARQRIELLLQKRDRAALRTLRAIDVLDQIGTPEARQALAMLSEQSPQPTIRARARAALERRYSRPG